MKQDPLALAFFGAAVALLGGLLLYVFVFKAPEPASAPAAPKPAAPQATAKQLAAPPPAAGATLPAGRSWRYAVVVDPPVWRDIMLTYRTQRESGGIGVLTEFVHGGGTSNFHLGVFSPGHPTHANTRFPGFFMYAAYLKQTLQVGDYVSFGWHWQGKSPGSRKRFDGMMKATEEVTVPAGTFRAALIEGSWSYLEDGQVRAQAHEKFWYAPSVSQIVKIERSGTAPDEGSRRIVAELAELR